jgi:hypothetical protein
MSKASDEQMAKLTPKDAASLKEFRRVVGTALRVMVDDELPKEVRSIQVGGQRLGFGPLITHSVIGRKDEKDAVPLCGMIGAKLIGKFYVVWLHPRGKASLIENGKLAPAISQLMGAGAIVYAPDVLGTGENAFPKPRTVEKNFAGYTFGYNRTLLANRVHDALTVIADAKSNANKSQGAATNVHLVGWGEMGVVAVLAKALAGDAVTKTAADLNQFRFENIKDTSDPMMLPGAEKYGGLGAFLALCAPGEVLAHNHKGTATGKLPKAAYAAAGVPDKLTRVDDKLDDAKVVEWLVK